MGFACVLTPDGDGRVGLHIYGVLPYRHLPQDELELAGVAALLRVALACQRRRAGQRGRKEEQRQRRGSHGGQPGCVAGDSCGALPLQAAIEKSVQRPLQGSQGRTGVCAVGLRCLTQPFWI